MSRLLTPLFALAGVAFVLSACGGSNESATTLEIRPILPTAAEASDETISAAFWNAMAIEGSRAGMHDAYQACLHPGLDVTVFDLDRYGTLVNPAFDAGYRAGSTAIATSCEALAEEYDTGMIRSPEAARQHRVATVGADYDTQDSHPDFGKGFDAAVRIGSQLDCDRAAIADARPPAQWTADYPSEFQSGYQAGLNQVASDCDKPGR